MLRIAARLVSILGVLAARSALADGETLRLVAWNVESGGITRSEIGRQLREFAGVDLWALSEVAPVNADFFIACAGDGEGTSFAGVIGGSGGQDRLLAIYDESKLDLVDAYELDELALGGRAPLVCRMRRREGSGEFLFVAVHLHRRDREKRLTQATWLRDWTAAEGVPILVAGDCNFDYEVPDGPGNEAFDEFALGGTLEWERPAASVASQFSDANGDGRNDHESVLDFVWTAGEARTWEIETEIVVRDGDFPDDNRTSDHRPLSAVIDATPRPTPLAADARPRLRIAHGRSGALRDATQGEAGPRPASDSPQGFSLRDGTGVMELGDRPSGFGRFEGRVVTSWDESGRTMTLLEEFGYVDGASIPRAFWSVIGGPFEGRYRNASVVHDVYCDSQERPWREVHRMFYEACRCGGASAVKSKLMYYAVYHFGPRWGPAERVAAMGAPPLDDAEVAAVEALIKWRDPSLDELESLAPAAFHREN